MNIILKITKLIIKVFYRKQYRVEAIMNRNDTTYIQYFCIGTRVVWIKPATEIIKNNNLLNLFSPQDACLIGFVSID